MHVVNLLVLVLLVYVSELDVADGPAKRIFQRIELKVVLIKKVGLCCHPVLVLVIKEVPHIGVWTFLDDMMVVLVEATMVADPVV